MKSFTCAAVAVAVLLALAGSAQAQGCANKAYDQCGGAGFKGTDCCAGANSCTVISSDFSQCLPAGGQADTPPMDPSMTMTPPVAGESPAVTTPPANATTPPAVAPPTDTTMPPAVAPPVNGTMPPAMAPPVNATAPPVDPTTVPPTNATAAPPATPAGPTTSPFPGCGVMNAGLDYPGNDLAEITGVTVDQCGQACAAIIQCSGISYTTGGLCYLKTAGIVGTVPEAKPYTLASYDLSTCDPAAKTVDINNPAVPAGIAAQFPGAVFIPATGIVPPPPTNDTTGTDTPATNTTTTTSPAIDPTTGAPVVNTTTTTTTLSPTTATLSPAAGVTPIAASPVTTLGTTAKPPPPVAAPTGSSSVIKVAVAALGLVAASLLF